MDEEFREFELKDIFQTTPFRGGLQVPTGGLMSSGDLEAGDTPRISVTSMNNGIIGYYKDVDSKNYRTYENCISVSFLGTVFYHPYKASFDMKVHCLKPIDHELRRGEALYLISCIQKLVQNNTYGNQTSSTDLPYIKVYLPVNDNGEPDFDYMQERIEELEQERIEELEQERIEELEHYLVATGLNDYELTDEDIETLSLSGFGDYEERDSEDAVKVCKEFKISDLFESFNGDTDLQKSHINGLVCNVVSSGLENNGIIGKTDIKAKIFDSDTITIDMFGNCFYRDEQYKMVTHARVFSLSPLFEGLNSVNGQYIVSQFKYLPTVYNYSNMCSWNKIKNDMLSLPIQTDIEGNPIIDTECKYHPDGYIPDFDFMEKYIKAIEKIVVADVVKYKDSVISKTKEVVT